MHLAAAIAAALLLTLTQDTPAPDSPSPDTSFQEDEASERLAAVRAELDELSAQVAARRGLELDEPVPIELLGPDAFRAALRTQIAELHREHHFEHTRSAFRLLGLLPPRFDGDLIELNLDALAGKVFGLYSPTRQTILVPDQFDHPLYRMAGGEALRREILAHELQHALQDRRWKLAELVGRDVVSHDARLAHGALMEGDAVATGMDWMLALGGSSFAEFPLDVEQHLTNQIEMSTMLGSIDSGALADPTFLAFSYGTGAALVHDLVLAGGWERVNAAFDDPPASTEQVLHRAKYLDERDWPTGVALDLAPKLADADWSAVTSDTLGELILREHFASELDDETVIRASFGWDGDRWLLLTDGTEQALVWSSVWDSVSDARAAHQALVEVLRLNVDADDDGIAGTERRDAGAVHLRRDGKRLALSIGLPTELRVAAVDHALASELSFDERDERKGRGDSRTTRRLEREALAALEADRVVVDGRTVLLRDLDLTLTLPSEHWQVEEDTPMATIRLLLTRATPATNFNVSIAPSEGLSPQESMDATLEFLRSAFGEVVVELAEVIDDPRGAAFELRYTMDLGGTLGSFHQLALLRGEEFVVLTCTEMTGSDDPRVELEFQALMDSATFGADGRVAPEEPKSREPGADGPADGNG